MTILAVMGLTAAAVVGSEQSSRTEELDRQIEDLNSQLEERDSKIAGLEDSIQAVRDSIDEIIVGFKPCWPGPTREQRYFRTYDVTFANGRYSVSKHRDFPEGIQTMSGAPAPLVGVLDSIPAGEIDEATLFEFGDRVSDALGGFYSTDCQLAVTINLEVTGIVVSTVNRAGFYTLYR